MPWNTRAGRASGALAATGLLCLVLSARAAAQGSDSTDTQPTGQIWVNATLDWYASPRVMFALDVEPKILVSSPPDQPGWASVQATPSVDFAAAKWLDLVGEGVLGYTSQTDNLNSTEYSLRGGARVHLFSRLQQLLAREHVPKRRLVIRDLARWEWRRYVYSDGQPTQSTWRFRDRIEFLYPLNRPSISSDGAFHLVADWEWFFPITDQHERFANRRRFRTGLGYRHDQAWQLAALYIRTNSRNTIDDPFETTENIFDLQIKRTW
jgi:hypothetical protein